MSLSNTTSRVTKSTPSPIIPIYSSAIDALGVDVELAHTLPHTGDSPERLFEVILGAATTR
jgi:hypothetical protein